MRVPYRFENPLCSEVGTEIFFPDTGEQAQAESAKKICKKCTHMTECLEWAMAYEYFGVWGATSPRERMRTRRKLNIRVRNHLVA